MSDRRSANEVGITETSSELSIESSNDQLKNRGIEITKASCAEPSSNQDSDSLKGNVRDSLSKGKT